LYHARTTGSNPAGSASQTRANGVSLYKTNDNTKLKDYTLRNVRQQVRKEQGGGAVPPVAG
jgi:hypothetical protein